jgi:hypothetical protein
MSLPDNAAVTLEEVKAQLNQTLAVDDALIERKIMAAQSHLESLLGFTLAVQYPTTDDEDYPATVPAALKECVCLLTANWYENRESILVGVNGQPLPIGVDDVVANFRNYSWAD